MLDLIKTRRSTRKYLDRPVPRELLEQIVEAGDTPRAAGITRPDTSSS